MTDGSAGLLDDPWGGCNPLDPAFRDDPYPRLAKLRERDPVNLTPIGIWRLLRYDDVARLLRDVRCGVRTTDGMLPGVDESDPEPPPLHAAAGSADPHAPAQARRAAPSRRARSSQLRDAIQRVVDECLDRVRAARRDGRDRRPRAAGAGDHDLRDARRAGSPIAIASPCGPRRRRFGLAAPILPPEVLEQGARRRRVAGRLLRGADRASGAAT